MEKRRLRQGALLIICIGINLFGRYLALLFHLPVWLDVVGTCIAAYFIGPAGGLVAGVSNNLIYGIWNPSSLIYMLTGVVVGLVFSICAKRGYLEEISKAMIASFLIGLLSVIISVPLNLFMYDGKSGNMWGDAFYDMLDWYGRSRVVCAAGDELIVEIVDKPICVLLAFLLIRWISKRRTGTVKKVTNMEKIRRVFPVRLICVLLATSLVISLSFLPVGAGAAPGTGDEGAAAGQAEPEESVPFMGQYLGTIYDSNSGMPASEANDIDETADGYIWFGSYAGLTRYDGQNFEFVRKGGIASVTTMHTDSRGRLWVGTNDRGIARYENGVFTFFTVEDGLPANSIRSFAETEDGTVYVGTTDRICKIDLADRIQVISEKEQGQGPETAETAVMYINSMAVYAGMIVGATNSGSLFVMKDDRIITTLEPVNEEEYYTCVAVTEQGLMAGTSGNSLEVLKISGEGVSVDERIETEKLVYLSDIRSDSEGRIWICADNGFGYLDAERKLQIQSFPGFDSSVECMHEDYEGNIWFASSRYGVVKFSKNQFTNLFALAGIEGKVVNAVLKRGDKYYCGTDTGLVILDERKRPCGENELTRMIGEDRVRSLMVDSRNRLWISTYSDRGLIRYDTEIEVFNQKEKGTISDRFRCTVELSDGMIAAGTSDGIQFIQEDKVIDSITAEDGLGNPQILCLLEGADGTLYAGSDGAGIYAIRDRKIVQNYTDRDGLPSDVILRMTEYDGGYFVVCSNSLCYMKDGKIHPLEKFPYFNNYDVIVSGEDAYVLSSSGIYVADVAALSAGREFRYKLYNNKDGLQGGLTANSWNYMDEEGTLYFCCNNGVTSLNIQEKVMDIPYKFGIASVTGDNEEIREENGVYRIPANVKQITLQASLRNFAMTEVKMQFYIEELQQEPEVITGQELQPIQISNLAHGTYHVHLKILNGDGSEVLQEGKYTLEKEAQVWENTWYVVYLVIVAVWLIAFLTWVVLMFINIIKRRKELEELRQVLEDTVNAQTEQIRQQADRMSVFQWSVVERLARLIESRDGNTGAHVINTRNYVALIANELLRQGLFPETVTREYVDCLIRVAPLHDVGKIKISDVILNKPGRFTAQEYEVMKKHAAYGGEIVGDILGSQAEEEMVQMAEDVANYHHEKWDGSGYPMGKKGEEIPLSARIMAVADVFDALVSRRVYKDAMAVDKAFAIIKEESGRHFDTRIVEVFLGMKEEAAKMAGEDGM